MGPSTRSIVLWVLGTGVFGSSYMLTERHLESGDQGDDFSAQPTTQSSGGSTHGGSGYYGHFYGGSGWGGSSGHSSDAGSSHGSSRGGFGHTGAGHGSGHS